jgi:2-dehydropantoate 2-reductase
VVLIALKTTSNAALPALIPPLLGGETALVTLQNGLGNEEFLAAQFGARRVMGGLCFVCLNRTAPGVIEHFGHGTLSVGEFKGPPQDRTMRLVTDFQRAGVEAKAVQSLITERWRKLVWNIPFNGLGIAAAANVAQVLNDEHLHAAARALMAEVIEAAGSRADFIDFQIQRSVPMGEYRSSSQIDYEAGREVEVESIWGEPLRQGRAAGADTPRLELLYALLRRLAGKRGA